MSKIQVNEIVNHFDNGAPDCPRGLTVTGVSTFSGSVSIGGTLSYEDVTNIDSVGIITAQSGINVGPTSGIGITISANGNITAAGTATFADTIQSGGNPVSGTATGAQLNSSGGVWVSNVSGTQSVFRGYTTGNSTETIRINANGSAEFSEVIKGTSTTNNVFEANTTLAATAAALRSREISSGATNKYHLYCDANSTDVVKIDTAGNATFAGNLTSNAKKLGTGAAGTGKVVGYQQGTWTPVWAESGNLNNVATSYSNRVAYWWRIGDVVTVSVTMNMASSAGISPNNQLVLKDFPYRCQAVPAYYGSSSSIHANGWSANTTVFVNVLLPASNTKADIYYSTSSQAGNYGGVDYSIIGTGSMIFNMSYLTDDTTWTPVNGAAVAS